MATNVDMVVVGAGFSGLYMLHKARSQGLSVRVLEAAPSVGGTWYWNRYPGARVDIESCEYSYAFSEELQDEWKWSERYAPQEELLRYLNYVADRFDLRPHIQLNTRVLSAVFDESTARWTLSTDTNTAISAQFCVMATGCLSMRNEPNFPGKEEFKGKSFHTANWPHEGVEFTGLRVGVIGTGSSAVQSIPVIAEQAAHLTVFQRTPAYSAPAHNHALSEDDINEWAVVRKQMRPIATKTPFGVLRPLDLTNPPKPAAEYTPEELEARMEQAWKRGGFAILLAANDIATKDESNALIRAFMAKKIRETVKDPQTAEKLTPKTFPVGSKRLCVDTGYYETYNRPNVNLVDVSENAIACITPNGIQLAGGETYDLDCIVYATGFDALTGALNAIDIRGRGGASLKEKWANGPVTYLGLTVAGFPNLFTITGPQSPSVLSNMAVSIEQHINTVADMVTYVQDHGFKAIEATSDAETRWGATVDMIVNYTLFPKGKSWYNGSNIAEKPKVFMVYIGVDTYCKTCTDIAARGYDGFLFSNPGETPVSLAVPAPPTPSAEEGAPAHADNQPAALPSTQAQ